ncbi:HAD-like protein [Brevundimonas phage vB_BpoS-Marchewka]|uniref:HAD-like protein n=1 Tax=Brevundimonas phage vB_BpoS-Marchewka TaxID=2948604 RepID=A0A9E7STY7_9CAUD|nr:HAD-like protein [Brevundimonas phage vB_BpoS-Marchewka]UTC29328.1 hypothetical protein BAMBUS_02460 [Brevundimonas phage vB_BpoS-Bambus]
MTANPRLISLDVWNTIISANPAYSTARDAVFRDLPLDLAQIKAVYREHKDGADRAAEERGEGLTSEATYKKFALAIDPTGDIIPWALQRRLEEAFRAHPPLIRPDVVEALQAVHAAGVQVSIGSNTNFIRGRVLYEAALARLDVPFAFKVFSDVHAVSKPHPEFWRIVKTKASAIDIYPTEIVHVGDNEICDGGCEAHGIRFAHTPNPEGLAPLLKGLIA